VAEDIQKEQVAQEEEMEEKQMAGLAKVRKACEGKLSTTR
jgi:hypothetical protein